MRGTRRIMYPANNHKPLITIYWKRALKGRVNSAQCGALGKKPPLGGGLKA